MKLNKKKFESVLDEVIRFLDGHVERFLKGGPLAKHYQIYALCAAYLHILNKIKRLQDMPNANNIRSDQDLTNRLLKLEQEIDGDEETDFKKASSASTQRIRTRKARVKAFIEALGE
ncbi:MAG: hypothetical protein HC889_06450 [Synechococcaceae cyanobacterium SM1_2_3]|nr:hypothetical protein [Synechococcaceae cyanobacterium SM1_2_3]